MTVGKKEQNRTESREGKLFTELKEHLINDLPLSKENADNDFDKTVRTLTKHEVLNDDCPLDQPKLDQSQEVKKHQNDIQRNNTVPSSPSDRQASWSQALPKNKNAYHELDGTVSNNSHTEIQRIRDHEIAMGVNNERHRTLSEIEAQVDNNMAMDMPDNDLLGDVTQLSDSNSVPSACWIEAESVTTTAAVGDQSGKAIRSDVGENVSMAAVNTLLTGTCCDCDGTVDLNEDELLQPVLSENADSLSSQIASSQQQSEPSEYSHSNENHTDHQLVSLPPGQQPADTNSQGKDRLQSLSDLTLHSSSQQLLVVVPSQPKQQHLVVDDGKSSPLKQLLSVECSLSDHLPESDTVQHHSNENAIESHSPHTVTASYQQLDTGDQREDSSQYFLSDEHSITELSPVASVSSQQQAIKDDLFKDKPVQDQSDQNAVSPSLRGPIPSHQQLDTDSNCLPQLPSKGKSHITTSLVSTRQQSRPVGQKISSPDIDKHLSDTVTPPRQSGNGFRKHLSCTTLLPPPARPTVIRRQKECWKRRKRRHKKRHGRRMKHSKPRKKRLHSCHISPRCYHEQEHSQPQPLKDEELGPTNGKNNNTPTNRGSTDTEHQGSGNKRGNPFHLNTQQASSPGGGNSNDGGGDEDEDEDPYSGRTNFRSQHNDPNWILLLLIVLLILCFCFPRPEDTPQQALHTNTESICSTGQHHTTSLDLKSSSYIPVSSLDDHPPALFRGGVFSKQRRNGGEESTSSSTFPGGCSTDHLVSEEETPRFMCQGEEMAGLKKHRFKRRPNERPHSPPSPAGSPRPQLVLDVFESEPSLTSEPKFFTYPSPDGNSQEVSCDYVAQRREHTSTHSRDSVNEHIIFHSRCVFKSPRLGPSANVRHILTDVEVHQQQQQSPPLHYITDLSNADSTNATRECEEEIEQLPGDNDPPSQFRGPGTAYKKPPDRNEGCMLDSGVGTNSVTQNQATPTAQTLPVAAAEIDTSWRTSIKKDKIVYLTPSTKGGHRSNFQVILSVEEQTPRSPNCRDELVGVKQFNQKDNSTTNEPADALSLQPPDEPLLERCERTSLLLEPSMRIFPYPSPDDEYTFQDIPEESCVFISGSTLYTNRRLSFPVTCSILMDDTIHRSQRYPLLYFTTNT